MPLEPSPSGSLASCPDRHSIISQNNRSTSPSEYDEDIVSVDLPADLTSYPFLIKELLSLRLDNEGKIRDIEDLEQSLQEAQALTKRLDSYLRDAGQQNWEFHQQMRAYEREACSTIHQLTAKRDDALNAVTHLHLQLARTQEKLQNCEDDRDRIRRERRVAEEAWRDEKRVLDFRIHVISVRLNKTLNAIVGGRLTNELDEAPRLARSQSCTNVHSSLFQLGYFGVVRRQSSHRSLASHVDQGLYWSSSASEVGLVHEVPGNRELEDKGVKHEETVHDEPEYEEPKYEEPKYEEHGNGMPPLTLAEELENVARMETDHYSGSDEDSEGDALQVQPETPVVMTESTIPNPRWPSGSPYTAAERSPLMTSQDPEKVSMTGAICSSLYTLPLIVNELSSQVTGGIITSSDGTQPLIIVAPPSRSELPLQGDAVTQPSTGVKDAGSQTCTNTWSVFNSVGTQTDSSHTEEENGNSPCRGSRSDDLCAGPQVYYPLLEDDSLGGDKTDAWPMQRAVSGHTHSPFYFAKPRTVSESFATCLESFSRSFVVTNQKHKSICVAGSLPWGPPSRRMVVFRHREGDSLWQLCSKSKLEAAWGAPILSLSDVLAPGNALEKNVTIVKTLGRGQKPSRPVLLTKRDQESSALTIHFIARFAMGKTRTGLVSTRQLLWAHVNVSTDLKIRACGWKSDWARICGERHVAEAVSAYWESDRSSTTDPLSSLGGL